MSAKIKKIEMNEDDFETVTCPFCETKTVSYDEESYAYEVKPCPHLLFFCYDDGWDFLSHVATENLTSIGYEVNDDEIEMVMPGSQMNENDQHSPDHITDRINIPGAIKYACYQGPPSLYGTYVGFAPLAESP